MSAGGKMNCENRDCGKDISMTGAQICSLCDPDIQKIIVSRESKNTPNLCEGCFEKHVAAHKKENVTENCPNCNEPGYDSINPCFRCGHSQVIG